MGEPAVRPARPADFAAVAALLAELGRPPLTADSEDAALAVYARHLARSDTMSLVAEIDGSVIGFMSLEFRERLNRTQLQAWIPDIIVTPAHRGKGVGRALLTRGIALAKERGCWSVTLESGRSRLVAHRLYQSARMVDEGEYFIVYFGSSQSTKSHGNLGDVEAAGPMAAPLPLTARSRRQMVGGAGTQGDAATAGPVPAFAVAAAGCEADRAWLADLWRAEWGGAVMVSRGVAHGMEEVAALLAWEDGRRIGALTYRLQREAASCELLSINALEPGRGVGSALLATLEGAMRAAGIRRVWLVTGNDNLDALRFYQRRGYRLAAVHVGAVDAARRRKPVIPSVGCFGIPLHDEIELERRL